jgi:hypothetical protein
MNAVPDVVANLTSGYDASSLQWKRLTDPKKTFDYHVDYWVAIIGFDMEKKHVDFLGKWEPNSYCHYHRHLSPTTSIVLAGEHHLVDESGSETVHKIRVRGDIATTEAGESHMEYGGPEGSMLLFSMDCDGGEVFQVLDKNENVMVSLSFEDFVTENY